MPDFIKLRYPTRGARAVLSDQAQRLPYRWGIALDRVAAIHVEELEKRTPESHSGEPGHRGGGAKRGWRVRRVGRGATAARIVYNLRFYVDILRTGRSEIPKPGQRLQKPLHFWANGREYYRWHVKAVAPNRFVENARAAAKRRQAKELQAAARAVITREIGP